MKSECGIITTVNSRNFGQIYNPGKETRNYETHYLRKQIPTIQYRSIDLAQNEPNTLYQAR